MNAYNHDSLTQTDIDYINNNAKLDSDISYMFALEPRYDFIDTNEDSETNEDYYDFH